VAAILIPTASKAAVTVQLIFVSTGSARATHPRWAVDVAAGVELVLVTTHVDAADCAPSAAPSAAPAALAAAAAAGSSGGSGALTNSVGQLRLGEGAIVRHSLCVERGASATHIETVEADVGTDAQYYVTTFQSPATLCRVNVGITLGAPGAQGHARGLMLSGGEAASALDLHTVRADGWPPACRAAGVGCGSVALSLGLARALARARSRSCACAPHPPPPPLRPHLLSACPRPPPPPRPPGAAQTIRHLTRGCSSSQLQKNLLAQKGRAVFRGLIRANEQAAQTVANQLSRSMLLSDGAKLDVLPCLEIIADDVECTHGATVAELDEEKVFYFRARGISAEAARFALVKGFALEMLSDVPYEVRAKEGETERGGAGRANRRPEGSRARLLTRHAARTSRRLRACDPYLRHRPRRAPARLRAPTGSQGADGCVRDEADPGQNRRA
jgi:hypothetical protein